MCFGTAFSQGISKQDNKQPETAPAPAPDLDKIISDFDAYAEKTMKRWNVPGMSVCVAVGDKVVYKKSFGVRSIAVKGKTDDDTIFQIASCTKAFTAVLTATLVDIGVLHWDDKVVKYLPDFRLSDKKVSDAMTIEDLLSQDSALPPYSQHLMMLFDYDKDFIIDSMRYIKLQSAPKTQYSYQNNLYLVMGEVIKKATGKSWEQNIREMIFNPLNMKSSSTDLKSYLKSQNRAAGHNYYDGKLIALKDTSPYMNWPYTFAPASGINSNIDDMSRWLLFLINGASAYGNTFISAPNFEKLFERHIFVSKSSYDNTKSNYYCLGWRCSEYENGEDIFWHAGSTDGHGAYVSFLRDKKIGLAILMNLPNGRMADALSKRLYDSYLQNPETDWSEVKLKEADNAYKNRYVKDPPSAVTPPLKLEKYVGKYENILYGVTEVRLQNGKLQFSAGSKKLWITMRHFSGNSFDGAGVAGWKFKKPMFVFKVYESSNVKALYVEDMSDGVDAVFRKIK